MNKVLDGGLYAIGALIACTIWYAGAMLVREVRVQSAVNEMAAHDRALLEFGPGPDADEVDRYLELVN